MKIPFSFNPIRVIRKNKNLWTYLVPIILIIGIGIFVLVTKPWQQSENGKVKGVEIKLIDYENPEYGFKLKYPEGFVEGKISEEIKKKDQMMLKLVRVDPPTLILISQETGLGVVEAFIKQPLLQYLKGNVDKTYQVQYNDFQKEKIEDSRLAGLEAFTVWFTFQDPKKDYREKIKVFVTVKDKVGYYLQCMAPVEMWDEAEPSCDIIKDSFEFIEKNSPL